MVKGDLNLRAEPPFHSDFYVLSNTVFDALQLFFLLPFAFSHSLSVAAPVVQLRRHNSLLRFET